MLNSKLHKSTWQRSFGISDPAISDAIRYLILEFFPGAEVVVIGNKDIIQLVTEKAGLGLYIKSLFKPSISVGIWELDYYEPLKTAMVFNVAEPINKEAK